MIFYSIILIVLGVLAAPALLLSRKPNAQELLDKIAPYQGWLGVVFCFWGLWVTIRAVLGIALIKYFPVLWITWLAIGVLQAVLGFILGYGLINKLILSNSEEAQAKGQRLLAKLTPVQTKLGLASIILGVWGIVSYLLYRF